MNCHIHGGGAFSSVTEIAKVIPVGLMIVLNLSAMQPMEEALTIHGEASETTMAGLTSKPVLDYCLIFECM